MTRLPLTAVLATLIASCAGNAAEPPAAQPAAPAPSATPSAPASAALPPAPAAPPVVGPPSVAWRDMTRAEREKYMDAVVVPKMQEVFVAHDAKAFADFGCETCHGKGATDGTFVMPNPDLPVLPEDPAAFQALVKAHPDAVAWMSEKVKPAMATLLGKEMLNPENPRPDAVSCGTCHTMKGP